MGLWMWHQMAVQQRAGAKRDLHMHAWLESVQAGQMSPAGRSTGPVARYRLVTAWPSKVAAGIARAEPGTTVAMATITLAVERIERACGSAPPPANHMRVVQRGPSFLQSQRTHVWGKGVLVIVDI